MVASTAQGDGLIDRTPSAYAYPLLIKQLLHTPLAWESGHEIVYKDKIRYSYATFARRVGQLANALAALGVGPGDTVAVMDWDSHRYLECYFAIPMMGAVIETVNIRLNPEQVQYTLDHAGASVVLVNREFVPLLDGMIEHLPALRQIVLIRDFDETPSSTLSFAGEYEEMLAGASPDYDFPELDENTRATTFYTTGTTGLPKGVYFSHRQLVLQTLAQCAGLGTATVQGRIHRDDVYMPITPMFHVHAWGFPYAAVMLGMKQVYPGRYAPETLLALRRDEGVTFSHCVPTILHMLLNTPASRDMDLAGWKIIIGGSALSVGLARTAIERGIDVFSSYGMSETCPFLTVTQLTSAMLGTDPDAELSRRTKAGIPMPLVEVRTVDAEMNDVPRDGKSVGEIVVRTPWLTQGYLKNPQASETLWAGGYLHTNDIGCIGLDGYLQITDRIKDVIKTGGEWISSLEIENVISRNEAVSEVAVIGVPDAKWGERPLALVVLKETVLSTLDATAIKMHMKVFVDNGTISKFGIPDQIIFVKTLTRTSVGKLDKKALRAQYS